MAYSLPKPKTFNQQQPSMRPGMPPAPMPAPGMQQSRQVGNLAAPGIGQYITNQSGNQGLSSILQGRENNPNRPDVQERKSNSVWDDLTNQYNDIRKQHEDSWAGKQELAGAQMAAYQRRADALSAQSGRSVLGGGAAGSTRQGMIQGMQHMSAVRGEHDQQSRQLQMAWLDKQIQQAYRDQDYNRQKELMGIQQNYAAEAREDEQVFQTGLQQNELAATTPGYKTPEQLAARKARNKANVQRNSPFYTKLAQDYGAGTEAVKAAQKAARDKKKRRSAIIGGVK